MELLGLEDGGDPRLQAERGELATFEGVQDRLVNELRHAGIGTLAEANTYLREHFIPEYNVTFPRPPADPAAAFVPLGDIDLDQILCEEEERTVGQDNTIAFAGVRLQLAKQPGRPTCAGLRVIVRRHLDGSHTVWRGAHCLGRYAATGDKPAQLYHNAYLLEFAPDGRCRAFHEFYMLKEDG